MKFLALGAALEHIDSCRSADILLTNVWQSMAQDSTPRHELGLDRLVHMRYAQDTAKTQSKPAVGIGADPEILRKARVRAVMQRRTLGRWLEEAIVEKLEREDKSSKEAQE